MRSLYVTLSSLCIALTVASCGGGGGGSSSSANVTGKFVDATVVGISYRCGSATAASGITDADGQYTCRADEKVAFYVGDILVGSVNSPMAVVTPLDLIGNGATPTHNEVANIVRFLMSISSTNPSTGTLTIDPAIRAAATGKSADFTAATDTVLDALIGSIKPAATIFSRLQASNHVEGSIKGLFAGTYSGTYGGASNGTWSITIDSQGVVSGTSSVGAITGQISTTLSTGSTYGFTGNVGPTTWSGTLNISNKTFKGTWTVGGSSGTWSNK